MAHIILLLISPDFMASEYCYSKEMLRAMARHNQGEAQVIPILLRPTHWKGAPFGKLQALPTNAKPITDPSWVTQDRAFVNIVTGILMAIEQLPMRSSETAETILMKLGKTPGVPLIETTDAAPTSTQPQLSVISTPTPSSPLVSVGNEILPALEEGEQGLPDWDDFPPPLVNPKNNLPPLTVGQVKSAWDRVVKRVKQRSPTTAAMLKYYNMVGIEDTAEEPIIIIQAQKQGHYNYVHENERSQDIEWALTTEFGQKCRVRLLSPGTPLERHLFLQLVQERWDSVVKQVKQRSPTTAAMLKYYNIVSVENMAEQSVVVIKAQKQGHYNYVHENDRSQDIEWALTTELGQKCGVRLLPPGTPFDPSL